MTGTLSQQLNAWWEALGSALSLTYDITLLCHEKAGSAPPPVGCSSTFQSCHYEGSCTSGCMHPDSDKGARGAAYLRARKPGQHFIDTHEYLIPAKTGSPALPASPVCASVYI